MKLKKLAILLTMGASCFINQVYSGEGEVNERISGRVLQIGADHKMGGVSGNALTIKWRSFLNGPTDLGDPNVGPNQYLDVDLFGLEGNKSHMNMVGLSAEIGLIGGTSVRPRGCGGYFQVLKTSLHLEKEFPLAGRVEKKNKTKNSLVVTPEAGLVCKLGNILFSLGGAAGGFLYKDSEGVDTGGGAAAARLKLMSSKGFSLIGEAIVLNSESDWNAEQNIRIYGLKGTIPVPRFKRLLINVKAESNSSLGNFGAIGLGAAL